MTTAYSTLLGLALPVQGELSGVWGDTIDNGITRYLDIAVAGTVTLTNDGAVTLSLTNGDSTATNIVSSLTGAGTTSAQFAIIRVTGTLTVAKVLTAPSSSRTYVVVNAATGSTVTVKASGQTGVSIAVGETAFVYFNGTDYVKIVGTSTAGAAGGSTTQVQYNNAGVLAGITGATTNGTALTLVAPVLGTPASGTVTNLTGTASININGTVGATTATTGAFTTLTTSSTVTLNGGTANGVAYLDASKVLTTGTALTFDGTDFKMPSGGSMLLGASVAGASLLLINGTAAAQRLVLGTSGTDGVINVTRTSGTGPNLIFQQESVEVMRLTSTSLYTASTINVGIGTSSPAYKLHVANYMGLGTQSSSGAGAGINMIPSSTLTNWFVGSNYVTPGAFEIIPSTAGGGSTFSTPALVLNSSGNVGIGTSSPTSKLQVNSGATTTVAQLISSGANTYTPTASTSAVNTNLQLGGGGASGATTGMRFTQGGSFELYFGGVQEAGGAAAFVFQGYNGSAYAERARIDSAGNLGLGVTPSAWVGNTAAQIGPLGAITSSTSTPVAISANAYSTSAGWAAKYITTSTASLYLQLTGQHQWFNAPSGTAGNTISFTQAMTLDADGDLGIGTTTPAYKLDVLNTNAINGGVIGARLTTGAGTFAVTGANPRGTGLIVNGNVGSNVTIPIGGNYDTFGIISAAQTGTGAYPTTAIYGYSNSGTGNGYGLRTDVISTGTANYGLYVGGVTGATSNYGIYVSDTSATNYIGGNLLVGTTSAAFTGRVVALQTTSASDVLTAWNSATTGDNAFIGFYTEAGGTGRGSITFNRAAGLVSLNTTSDYRAKDISGPVTGSGALIDSTPVYMGKMKDATQERPMFIAHEVPAYAHTGEKDAVDADGNPVYQQMDAGALIPVMWAEIQSLRKRLAILESK